MWGTLVVLLVFASQALAQTAATPFVHFPPQIEKIEPVSYIISLARQREHVVHVEARFPAMSPMSRDVQLPVWNALYQVRDFAQYVRYVSAHADNGKQLLVRAVDKTTWHVDGAGEAFTFEYDIVADSPGPFGAQLNEEHAFFNLAEICVYMVGAKDRWISLRFAGHPKHWRAVSSMEGAMVDCGTPECAFQSRGVFFAANYDYMADSPVEIGLFKEKKFQDGLRTSYRVIVDGDISDAEFVAVANIARKIVTTETEWMQDQPDFLPSGFTFIYHFPRRPAGGGMEHAYSTAIDASADRVKRDPESIAGITAHEFFHLWNVKRIRPQSLEPVDYTREQYTRALWFSEGVTSTVADYMRVRAGLIDEKRYLEGLAGAIRSLESRPARLTQSVEESSLDAWLEKYSYYGQPERSISYYNKGEIVGVLLDLAVRDASGGKKSLRDMFQWMNQHYAKQGKFFPDSAGVQEAAEAVSGAKLHDFFARYVAGVEPLPYDQLFATVGLRLEKRARTAPTLGFHTSRTYTQPPTVTSVESDSEAEKAGVRAGDVVHEFNGKAAVGPLEPLLAGLHVGDTVHLKLSGAGGAREVKVQLGGREENDYALIESENATEAQRARRAAWVRGHSQP
jgi:predicted metalloprotease with PDZ domain